MFYIMYGQDSFSLHGELKKIKIGLGNPEMLEVNTNVLDGKEISFSQLQDVCSATPFLHQVRLVIVEGLLERFEPPKKAEEYASKGKRKSDSALKEWQELYSYSETMPATTVLILIDSDLSNKRNVLLKQLSPLAEIRIFPQLKSDTLKNWIKERILKGGGKASGGVINLLEKLIGNNLWNIDSEIEKLLAFCNGRLITEDDVRQITSYSREANIFALVDTILEGRRKEAQQLLHRLFQDGERPSHVLTMINRQLRLIIIAKEISADMDREQVMLKLGINQDWRLNILLRQAKIYPLERIRKAYYMLLSTDMAIKTGKYDDDLAMNLLVVDMSNN